MKCTETLDELQEQLNAVLLSALFGAAQCLVQACDVSTMRYIAVQALGAV